MDRTSRVRCSPGSSRTGAVLGLLLIATSVESWPWGSDLSCPPGPEPVCPRNPADDSANYFPHPTDCHYYIQCDGSRRPICRQCGPTVYFSPKILNCLWPLDAKCEHNATTRQDSLLQPICCPDRPPYSVCHSEGKISSGCSCDHYFRCNGGRKEKYMCPPGEHFNVNRGICQDPREACCEPNICGHRPTPTIPPITTTRTTTPITTTRTTTPITTTRTTTPITPTPTIPPITTTTTTTPTPCTSTIIPPTSSVVTCPPAHFPEPECPAGNGQIFPHLLNCGWYYICQDTVAAPTKYGCGFLYNKK